MCGKEEEDRHQQQDGGECSQTIENMFQEQLFLHHQHQHQQQQQQQNHDDQIIMYGDHHHDGGRGLIFPSTSEVIPPILQPWPPLPAQLHAAAAASFVTNPVREHNSFLLPPLPLIPLPPPPTSLSSSSSSSYASLFNGRSHLINPNSLQFAYDHGPSTTDHLGRILSNTLGVGPVVHHPGSASPFGLQAELGKLTAQEIMDAKALAASKSHSEAERRRRERINNHLAKLRSLLPSTTKTDKASLLAEVIQHVKELKRQTSLIAETSPIPTEVDELTVHESSDDETGKLVIKASLCCEDRSDLLPDLIKTLKSLHLRTLKAEITTLGGRVKNVLFVTGDDDDYSPADASNSDINEQQQQQQLNISSIQEALKAVMEKTGGDDSSSGNIKRQRTNNINIL